MIKIFFYIFLIIISSVLLPFVNNLSIRGITKNNKIITNKNSDLRSSSPEEEVENNLHNFSLEEFRKITNLSTTTATEAAENHFSSSLSKCEICLKNTKCVPPIRCPKSMRSTNPQMCDLPGGSFGFCCKAQLDENEFSHDNRKDLLRDAFNCKECEDHSINEITDSQPRTFLSLLNENFQKPKIRKQCPQVPHCFNSDRLKYRQMDGTCNNGIGLKRLWGAVEQPMARLLRPAYEDNIWKPREHSRIDKSPLSGARRISEMLLGDQFRPHSKYNLLLMQFGQFLAHDLSQSSSITLRNGESIECCSRDSSTVLPKTSRHFACMPIEIERDDHFYGQFKIGCMNFVRLSLAIDPAECFQSLSNSNVGTSYAKQMNRATSYLDASQIYGPNEIRSRELRTFHGGKLLMSQSGLLLPITRNVNECGVSRNVNQVCFKSGDSRVNEINSLIAMHVIFAREHNRVAEILHRLNPHFSDEMLFQEARKIVIAEIQHITYHEWLPLVIGPSQIEKFNLIALGNVNESDYSSDYDPNVNVAVTAEFSGAAFRFGHSAVEGWFNMPSSETGSFEFAHISDMMLNATSLFKRNYFFHMIQALLHQPMERVDNFISSGLSKFLFRGENPIGRDLASINIQRGRDLGLQTYSEYLKFINQHSIENFQDFDPEIRHKLARAYKFPDDIDLWIGGLLEPPMDSAAVGVTFSEIIAEQFSRLRQGDRYFYEHDPAVNPGHFTRRQLREIHKVTMARIICDNLIPDWISPLLKKSQVRVQRRAFLQVNLSSNPQLECDEEFIPAMNFEYWKS